MSLGELQGNTAAKRGCPRKVTAQVNVGQSPRWSRRADTPSDHNEGTSASHLQERDPASSQLEERVNRIY